MKQAWTYLFLFCLSAASVHAQNRTKITGDFLQLQNARDDSTRIRVYLGLAGEYVSYNNDSSLYYSSRAEDLLVQNPNLNQEAYAKYLKGFVYYISSELEKSQSFVNEALMITKGTNEKLLMAKCYNLLGAIHFNLGNYTESFKNYNSKLEVVNAQHDTLSIIETHYNISLINNAEGSFYTSLEHNYTGLGLSEKVKDTTGIMIACEGLGIAYAKTGDTKNAILFLKRALQLAIIKNRVYEQSGILVDLGDVYVFLKQYASAGHYYKRAEDIAFRNGDKLTGSLAISGEGSSFFEQGKLAQAKELFDRAIYFYKTISYVKGLAENHVRLAECDLGLGDYKSAKGHALNALAILKQLNEKRVEEKAYNILSGIYEKLNNTDSAFICYKKHILISDSLQAKSAFRKISEYESNLEKKKLQQERTFREKTARVELTRQKQIRNTVLVLSALILLMLLFVNRNYKLKQKANIEISKQKKIIEHKNKDIVDSINYSRRLQEAVLTTPAEVLKLLPGSFVLYKPKSHVSSAFYFVESLAGSSSVHIAVASCTGQGVPGAFMSIIGHNILKQALKDLRHTEPSQILEFLNAELKKFLRNEGQKNGITDGIEMAYCILDAEKKELKFSGANSPALISMSGTPGNAASECIQENGPRKLFRIKPAGRSIGFSDSNEPFITRTISLTKGDVVFLGAGFDVNRPAEHQLSEKIIQRLNSAADQDIQLLHDQLLNDIINDSPDGGQTIDICIIGIKL